MKKSLLIGATTIALALGAPVGFTAFNSNASSVIQGQTEVDFEQASMSDEEYLKHVINQFSELDTIESVTTTSGEGYESTSTMIADLKNGTAKIESVIPALIEGAEEYNIVSYLFKDGSMATDEVVYLETMIDLYSAMDPEFETKLQEVKEQVAGRLVITPASEEMGISLQSDMNQAYDTEGLVFNDLTKEGDIVRGALDMEAYFEAVPEAQESLAIFPEGTVYQVAYEVNAAEQTLTSITTMDLPESEETSSENDIEGISVAQFMSDSEVRVVARPSTETIPNLEELDTISREEFDQIVMDAGIETY